MIPLMKAAMIGVLVAYVVGFIVVIKFVIERVVNGG